jgi:hypothetical protein
LHIGRFIASNTTGENWKEGKTGGTCHLCLLKENKTGTKPVTKQLEPITTYCYISVLGIPRLLHFLRLHLHE